jgi:single-stranded-DNA-specific exonuclease
MINKFARENLQKDGLIPTIEADLEISFSDLSIELAQYLSILEPYGVGNPIPNFIIRGVTINEIVPISQGKHTRLSLGDGRVSYTGMFFSVSPESLDLNVGDSADVLFNVDINEFNGRRSLQLIIKDIRLSETEQQKRKSEEDRFAEIWSGMPFSSEENILPSREDFAALYKLILLLKHQNISTVSHRDLINKLSVFSPHMNINYIKLKVMIKVMIEMNIIGIEEEGEIYTFTVRYSTTKTDLERSGLLRRLRLQQKN